MQAVSGYPGRHVHVTGGEREEDALGKEMYEFRI